MARSMGSPTSFNDLHSTFVTTDQGTTLQELLQVLGSISLTPILVPLLLPWLVPPSFVDQAVYNDDFFTLVKAILEYPFLIVLPVWIITIFPGEKYGDNVPVENSCIVLSTIFFVPVCILILNHSISKPKWFGFWNHWERIKNSPVRWSRQANRMIGSTPSAANATTSPKLPFITSYRAIVIYITVLAILAVDFPIFPRRFAKTKAYGISLMDVGTGCFVFANGIVAPEVRNKKAPLWKSIKSTIPIIILGFVRLITVKGIEYQEVVEEYGVHWNFFFTLAGVKIFSSILFKLFDPIRSLHIAATLGIIYESLLNLNDFQNQYLLNPGVSRNENLVNANREGIFSVFGYLSIYIASIYFGKIINWKTRSSVSDWLGYAFQSLLQVSILWICYAISTLYGNPPCRRSANLSYVILMVALNYSLLWFQMFLSLFQVIIQHLGLIYGPMLFYELDSWHKKGQKRVNILQKRMENFEKLKKKNAEELAMEKEIEENLEQLEAAVELLKEEQKEGKRVSSITVNNILRIEDKIREIEKKLEIFEEEKMKYEKETSKPPNLVLFPDLSRGPIILEAICYNGLVVFLAGNLLTGLINCCIYTMYTSLSLSLCYLWFYATAIATLSVTLYWYEIQVKFW